MLRCTELNLSVFDLQEMTMGMVYDMLIEKSNDQEKYSKVGVPGTLKNFFGGGA